jgi:hypothetical protein
VRNIEACVWKVFGFASLQPSFLSHSRSVRKQVVNVPSFNVRLDSGKLIDFAMTSPYGSMGRPGRVKRRSLKKKEGGSEEAAGEAEED